VATTTSGSEHVGLSREHAAAEAARRNRIAWWVTALFALAGGGFLVYQGFRYGYFRGVTEWDDGVYYGSGVMLVHGILPYHSYVDVQPPGIVLLMAPFALLGEVTNSHTGFEWARGFVVLVSIANVFLFGRLVRNRSLAALIAGLAIITFSEGTLVAEHTVLLEPFLVFGTLLGFLLVFGDSERVHLSTRWLAAGVVLGLTTSIKVWGIVPLVVIAVLAIRVGRSPATRFLTGAAAGFLLVFLPFFVAAPVDSVREVIVDQALRHRSGEQLADRLALLIGAKDPAHLPGPAWVLLWVVLAGVVWGSIVLVRRHRPWDRVTQLDWCGMACCVLVFAALVVSAQFYPHYAAFLAPFLGLVVSATVGRLRPFARRAVLYAALIGAAIFAVYSTYELLPSASAPDPAATVDRYLPADVCILSMDNSDLLVADRFTLAEPGCPRALDWFGAEFTDANGNGGVAADATNAEVQNLWLGWLRRSDGLILYERPSAEPDFGPTVRSYVDGSFRLVAVLPGVGMIYRRSPSVDGAVVAHPAA
jgi:alpha-1,2-mannosyltransferase